MLTQRSSLLMDGRILSMLKPTSYCVCSFSNYLRSTSRQGNSKRAISLYKRSLQFNPLNWPAYEALCQLGEDLDPALFFGGSEDPSPWLMNSTSHLTQPVPLSFVSTAVPADKQPKSKSPPQHSEKSILSRPTMYPSTSLLEIHPKGVFSTRDKSLEPPSSAIPSYIDKPYLDSSSTFDLNTQSLTLDDTDNRKFPVQQRPLFPVHESLINPLSLNYHSNAEFGLEKQKLHQHGEQDKTLTNSILSTPNLARHLIERQTSPCAIRRLLFGDAHNMFRTPQEEASGQFQKSEHSNIGIACIITPSPFYSSWDMMTVHPTPSVSIQSLKSSSSTSSTLTTSVSNNPSQTSKVVPIPSKTSPSSLRNSTPSSHRAPSNIIPNKRLISMRTGKRYILPTTVNNNLPLSSNTQSSSSNSNGHELSTLLQLPPHQAANNVKRSSIQPQPSSTLDSYSMVSTPQPFSISSNNNLHGQSRMPPVPQRRPKPAVNRSKSINQSTTQPSYVIVNQQGKKSAKKQTTTQMRGNTKVEAKSLNDQEKNYTFDSNKPNDSDLYQHNNVLLLDNHEVVKQIPQSETCNNENSKDGLQDHISDNRSCPQPSDVQENTNPSAHSANVSILIRGMCDLLTLLHLLAQSYRLFCQYRSEECLAHLAQLSPVQKHSPWILALVGKAYFENNDYHKALEVFQRLRTDFPYHLSSLEYYSTILWYRNDSVLLSYIAHDLLAFDPHAPESWCAIGNCFSLQKEHEAALKFFQRAVQINPSFVYAYTLAAHEYIAQENWTKAIDSFREALRLDQRHYNAWYGLGTVYLRQGKLDHAAYYFNRALMINNRSSVLHCYAGTVQYLSGNPEVALRFLRQSVKLSPDNTTAAYYLAHTLLTLEQLPEAEQLVVRLKEKAPKSGSVHLLSGRIQKMRGNKLNAYQEFWLAEELDPKISPLVKKELDNLDDPGHLGELYEPPEIF